MKGCEIANHCFVPGGVDVSEMNRHEGIFRRKEDAAVGEGDILERISLMIFVCGVIVVIIEY